MILTISEYEQFVFFGGGGVDLRMDFELKKYWK